MEAMSAGVPTVLRGERGGAGPVAGLGAGVRSRSATGRRWCGRCARWRRAPRPAVRDRLARADAAGVRLRRLCRGLLVRVPPGVLEVSVVVPNYNYARYLPGRLASIVAQAHPVAEVVVLDDASSTTAGGGAGGGGGRRAGGCAGWAGAERGSVFAQWRRAATLARAEWLWIAEADDMCGARVPGALAGRWRGAGCGDGIHGQPGGGWRGARRCGRTTRRITGRCARCWRGMACSSGGCGAAGLAGAAQPDPERQCGAVATGCAGPGAGALRGGAGPFTMAGDWRVYAEVLSGGRQRRLCGAAAERASPAWRAASRSGCRCGEHLQEIYLMHRHMRGVRAADPGLLKGQREAMRDARAALKER